MFGTKERIDDLDRYVEKLYERTLKISNETKNNSTRLNKLEQKLNHIAENIIKVSATTDSEGLTIETKLETDEILDLLGKDELEDYISKEVTRALEEHLNS